MNTSQNQRTELDNIDIIGGTPDKNDKTPINKYNFSRRKSLLKTLFKFVPSRDRLLDLGCSKGSYCEFFRSEGFREIYGLDLSRQRAAIALEQEYDSVLVGRGQETPFPDRYFDVVVNQEVLVHVLQYNDRLAMVRESYRVLKKGGIYIISFPSLEGRKTISMFNRLFFVNRVKALKDRLTNAGEKKNDPSVYCCHPSASEMEEVLLKAGFEIQERLGHLYYYPEALSRMVSILKLIDSLLYQKLPYHCSVTYIMSRKP